MNTSDASIFHAKLGAARGVGDLLPELVPMDHQPMAKSPGKMG